MKFNLKLFFPIIMVLLIGCTQDLLDEHNNKIAPDSLLESSDRAYFSDIIGSTVLFYDNKSEFLEAGRDILSLQASWLQQNDDYLIVIEGHGDEKGTRDYNLSLGAKRASAVKDFFILNGIEEFRITIVTYGKERPEYVCSSNKCYSKNRRTVTVLKEK